MQEALLHKLISFCWIWSLSDVLLFWCCGWIVVLPRHQGAGSEPELEPSLLKRDGLRTEDHKKTKSSVEISRNDDLDQVVSHV